MNTHYFVGIKIPSNLATSIIEARDTTNLHETHKILPVAEDLHITLYYLGQIEQNSVDQIVQSLDQNIDWKSFDLTTNGISHFGNNLTPRVVYTALKESESLTLLQEKVTRTISNYIEVDNRKEFNAHITIAKKWASKGLLSMENFPLESTTFKVTNFSLFRVNPTNTPRYEELYIMHSGGG
ncbi:RNA 2',3'-cyclic phosphodiesterase [Psychrobacillus sp. L4]|uniref:RNA 2',3'-cyclic phosphodiesterase n=1 Tax=Psychrobacillus sp. L4 TaxID=3236892 RepID=UPI0036F1EA0F